MRFGVRASHVPRAASRDILALGLWLPDAHLMLAAQLHGTCGGERQPLFEQLHHLGTGDLLIFDRGYPSRWLVGVLLSQSIEFCLRVDTAGERGFAFVQAFRKSDLDEQIVTLPRPDPQDVTDFDCPPKPATVRLIRYVYADGSTRILMTGLRDAERFPAALFADLYHDRWSIEEAFKRLKHRLNIEHVSGLSHLALQQEFAANVLCYNLAAASTSAARAALDLPAHRRTNRAYARSALKPLIPALLLGRACLVMLQNVVKRIASQTFKHRPGRSRLRAARTKPHKHMAYKAC
jgi:hypothetical protein